MRTCRECGGKLQVLGTDGYGVDSLIEVQCLKCLISYLVEPDAFGMGGEELLIALEAEETGEPVLLG